MELHRHQSGMHFPLEQWNWSTSQLDASGLPADTGFSDTTVRILSSLLLFTGLQSLQEQLRGQLRHTGCWFKSLLS